VHLLDELVVGKLGEDDLVVGHFLAPRCRSKHGFARRGFSASFLSCQRGNAIADLRLTAKRKRLENQQISLSILRQALALAGRFA
jgi:hypothetical protein